MVKMGRFIWKNNVEIKLCAWVFPGYRRKFTIKARKGNSGLSYAHDFKWYWPEINPKMMHLIQTLGLGGYPQFEQGMGRFELSNGLVQTVRGYATQPACWRLNRGMSALIKGLETKMPQGSIRLNSPVCEIEREENHALVSIGEIGETPRARFRSPRVILALPPRLAAATILFTPDLSFDLTQAMLKMGTWMAGQAKFYALYP